VTSLGIAFKRRLEKSEQDDGKDVIQCVALWHELTKFFSQRSDRTLNNLLHTFSHF
jgi:hypothetical protein